MRGFRGMARAGLGAGMTTLAGCGLLSHHRGPSPAELRAAAAQDPRINAELERRLAAEPSIGAGKIRLEVQRGEVQLRGSVAGLGALQCAERNAELTPGVKLVIDFLVLEPGPRTVRCLAPRP
jgi:hypothetical protein